MPEPIVADLLACLFVLVLVSVLTFIVIQATRVLTHRRGLRRHLAADWWPRFERDLRAYERERSRFARERRED
jgi:hypothetical protein